MGAKRPGGKRPGGKRLGGETTRGGNGLGAKRPGICIWGEGGGGDKEALFNLRFPRPSSKQSACNGPSQQLNNLHIFIITVILLHIIILGEGFSKEFEVKVQDTRYKKLYLKSAFNFNISNISH